MLFVCNNAFCFTVSSTRRDEAVFSSDCHPVQRAWERMSWSSSPEGLGYQSILQSRGPAIALVTQSRGPGAAVGVDAVEAPPWVGVNVSLLPLQSWPPGSSPSLCKLHSDGCPSYPQLCKTLPPGCLHFPSLVCLLLHHRTLVCPNWLYSLGRPIFVWPLAKFQPQKPALPGCQNLPSHQAIHRLTTSLTTCLKIPHHNPVNPPSKLSGFLPRLRLPCF